MHYNFQTRVSSARPSVIREFAGNVSKFDDAVDLTLGEPDFNTPDHIKEAAKKAVDENFSRYSPVPGYPALRNAIVKKLKNENGLEYNVTQISCAIGAKQSVCNLMMVLLDKGDEVIIPAPF